MKITKLPHFPRLFSAGFINQSFTLSLWLCLLAFLGINYVSLTHTSSSIPEAIQIQKLQYEKKAHLSLSLHYTRLKATSKAARESALSMDTPNREQTLGITTTQREQNSEQEKLLASKQRDYWLSIVAQKPDYRDAWLQLAQVSQKLQRVADKEAYVKQAKLIDPNYLLE